MLPMKRRGLSESSSSSSDDSSDRDLQDDVSVSWTVGNVFMFDELCDTADKQLFDNIQTNDFHILHSLLPPESTASQNYSLRPPL